MLFVVFILSIVKLSPSQKSLLATLLIKKMFPAKVSGQRYRICPLVTILFKNFFINKILSPCSSRNILNTPFSPSYLFKPKNISFLTFSREYKVIRLIQQFIQLHTGPVDLPSCPMYLGALNSNLWLKCLIGSGFSANV